MKKKNAKLIYAQSSDIKARTYIEYRRDMKKKAIAELEIKDWLQRKLKESFKRNDIVVEKYGGDRFLWFLREGGITREPDFIARIGNGVWGKSFSIVDIGIGGSVGKKKKKFNWAKYEGRDDEIRKLAELLKEIGNWANLIR